MISKPTLLLDEQKCKANIAFMAERAKQFNVESRPHFKTHQSLEIGRWFKEAGVTKITASSLDMANYFAAAGWKDITLAVPVNPAQIPAIVSLAQKIKLNLLVDSPSVVEKLVDALPANTLVWIKVDCGYGRVG